MDVNKAPGIRLDVGQFAKVKALAKQFEQVPSDFEKDRQEWRLPIKIEEGGYEEQHDHTTTIRTKSTDVVWAVEALLNREHPANPFWIQKVERKNSQGNEYTAFLVSDEVPGTPANK